MYPEYSSDLAFCRSVHKAYGKSFYFGTLLMTPEYRDAICILYAFFRLPDEYIDTIYKDQKDVALETLHTWKEQWTQCYNGNSYEATGDVRKVLRAAKYVFDTYDIPFAYSEAFIAAMIQDASKTTYRTYEELEAYMYGSAVVVGYMMVHVICAHDTSFTDTAQRAQVLTHAKALGEAFQMTNFLRDIYEDARERDRVYLPLEDMQRFGITKQDILNAQTNQHMTDWLKYEIAKTRALYEKADAGLHFLPPREARAIHVARVLYSKILDKIEDAHYDVFSSRVHVGFWEKLYFAFLTLRKKI